MNKTQLIDTLRKETGLSKSKSEQVVELLFNKMSNALAAGDRVEIRGLFSIFVKDYEGYTGRNPKTGEIVEVPAKKLPFFKCGKELKDRVDYKQTKTKPTGDAREMLTFAWEIGEEAIRKSNRGVGRRNVNISRASPIFRP